MTGVEILAAQEVAVAYQFNHTMCLIVFWCTLIFLVVIGLAEGAVSGDWSILTGFIIIGIVWGTLFGILAGSITSTSSEYETQYKVTISDEVSMNDFLSKYEIIDQEGKIYTVRERTYE